MEKGGNEDLSVSNLDSKGVTHNKPILRNTINMGFGYDPE